MSSEAMGWVYRHSPYKGATFAVHLAIADSVNDQHEDRFWMTQARLASKARVARGSVVEAIQRMTDDGLLVLIEDRHAQGRSNEYQLLMPADAADVYARTLSAEPTRGARSADKPCAPSAQQLARSADKRNPSSNPSLNPTDARADAAPLRLLTADDTCPTFDGFWKLYPRGDGKPAAIKAWERALKAAPPERIMEGLTKWVAYWQQRAEPEFVPWAQKWLNQQQWDAAPPAVRRAAQPKGPGWSPTAAEDAAARALPSGRIYDL